MGHAHPFTPALPPPAAVGTVRRFCITVREKFFMRRYRLYGTIATKGCMSGGGGAPGSVMNNSE